MYSSCGIWLLMCPLSIFHLPKLLMLSMIDAVSYKVLWLRLSMFEKSGNPTELRAQWLKQNGVNQVPLVRCFGVFS